MRRTLVLLAFMWAPALVQSDEAAHFEGRVVVEWLDDNPFLPTMRIVQDFGFRQAEGRLWRVPGGTVLEGKSMPPLFRDRIGAPFEGSFRKSAVVYDYATQSRGETWKDAQRMFYEASVAEGVMPSEAKAMYLVLQAQGSRWEVVGSRCYGFCHGKSEPLIWRPMADDQRLAELLNWVRASDPGLEEVEARARAAILDPGPHVFPQDRCRVYSGSTLVKVLC